ncbi:hypothetical protein GALL_277230 [mine drainage metagenome]|uniref:AAA+ ATPase domain-containing protein n=1 Tax=mine drainage metagenome TaxID=410659 RepID=A0A1J5R377_9ZZZZ
MIKRRAESRIKELLTRFPAVALLGPRQVGKTTLSLDLIAQSIRPSLYLDLERPADRAKLADADAYLDSHEEKLIVLDELQRVPELFGVLRGIIDRRRQKGARHGHFLLLGSASIDLLKQSSETLAGRIATVELTPLLANEVAEAATASGRDRLWLRGGFPESTLARNSAESLEWREAFISTYLERDIPALGPRIPAETLRRFWTMLAHQQGALLNASALAAGLGVSGQSVARYLDLMVDLFLVRRLQPWTSNPRKRLVKSPKCYVRDSGLVHALLGLKDLDTLLGHPVTGGSWEGFVVESLLACAPAGTRSSFYRTSAGAEIDLVLEIGPTERWAVEIKRSSAPTVSKGFHLGSDDIDATRRIVVHAGAESFALGAGVEALTLQDAMQAVENAEIAARKF